MKQKAEQLLLRRIAGMVTTPFGPTAHFMCSWPHPYSTPNFGGVLVAPDRPCWASTSAWALSYLAMKLFSKNSNLCDHDT